jgi:hypothetical protein
MRFRLIQFGGKGDKLFSERDYFCFCLQWCISRQGLGRRLIPEPKNQLQ